MNRRNVLMGLTAATAGSMSLAFGSGAFTQVEAGRDFEIGLAGSDDEAQLVIEENDGVRSVAVEETDAGNFSIDADNVAPNAVTTYGEFGLDGSGQLDATELRTGVFVIRNGNETGAPVDITVGIDFDTATDASVSLSLGHPASADELDGDEVLVTNASEDNDATLGGIRSTEDGSDDTPDGVSEPDAEVECGFLVDTTDGGADETLSLTLSITAEQSEREDES